MLSKLPLVLLSASSCAAAFGQASQLQVVGDEVELVVDDSRPVAKAVELLSSNYPVVITYEDPLYRYGGDAEDIGDHLPRRPGISSDSIPRVLVPRGGSFTVRQRLTIEGGTPTDWTALLESIVAANESRGIGGRFAVQRSADVYHIVPIATRDATGQWIPHSAVLSARITVSGAEGNGLELLNVVVDAVHEATGEAVEVGAAPLNALFRYSGRLEAFNEPARDVLVRLLHGVARNATFHVYRGPSSNAYMLNISATAPMQRAAP